MIRKPITVLSIVGTRPEAVKMVPILTEFASRPDDFRSVLCVTAQHRELLDDILKIFAITPDHDLDVMRRGQSPSEVASAVMAALPNLLARVEPDWLVLQGDTTSALAAALAAFYARVPIAHVEAGLRTWDPDRPFPEEMNRVLIDRMARLHFAPTEVGRQNLLREATDDGSIVVTGNTVVDALHDVLRARVTSESTVTADGPPIVLVTAHRRESFGEPIRRICDALRRIADQHKVRIVYPVHPNPNIHGPVHELLGSDDRVVLLDPVDYRTLIDLLHRAILVLSDSGGIQEEATALGKPVLVLRDVTERPEGVEAGVLRVVGTRAEAIVEAATELLSDPVTLARLSRPSGVFGDGHAAKRIADALVARS